MHRTTSWSVPAAALMALLAYLAVPGIAEDAPPATAAEAEAEQPAAANEAAADTATDEAPPEGEATEEPSADDVLQDLLRRREESPLIEPARPRRDESAERSAEAEALAGIAPDAAEASLRREGQFVITRRGRMVRAPGDGSDWVFVFDADSSGMHEPPMYLMPCQLLEDMEQIVQEHGDSVVFIISGQIFLYRGANYLLPTLMQLAPDRGNLDP